MFVFVFLLHLWQVFLILESYRVLTFKANDLDVSFRKKKDLEKKIFEIMLMPIRKYFTFKLEKEI